MSKNFLKMITCSLSRRAPSADSCHSEHSGAEEAAHGPGHLHEDGGLFLHRHLLRSVVQRGNTLMCRRDTMIVQCVRFRRLFAEYDRKSNIKNSVFIGVSK